MEPFITFSPEAGKLVNDAIGLAQKMRNEFVTPEHLLMEALKINEVREAIKKVSETEEDVIGLLTQHLQAYLEELDTIDLDSDDPKKTFPTPPSFSNQFETLLTDSLTHAASSGRGQVETAHILHCILNLSESTATYYLDSAIRGLKGPFLSVFLKLTGKQPSGTQSQENNDQEEDEFEAYDFEEDLNNDAGKEEWRQLVTDITAIAEKKNPLIGREEEMERTILTLCRKEKNNPLHVGEPGVGKTAMIYGLARLINSGNVPEALKESKIYGLDMGTLVAGTQYRGEFESRIRDIMQGISKEKNPIVYIDEIHTLVGSGANSENSLDGGNMLKPYLEAGDIRFIGSTTYEEFKKQFSKSKGIVRRFQQIDIEEPSIEETIKILQQLKSRYEEYHGVKYTEEAIRIAVEGSSRYLPQRYLPDKAIDLIDEAGAYLKIHPEEGEDNTVDKSLVTKILAKIAHIDRIEDSEETSNKLTNLEENIRKMVYGQDEAVKSVSESVLLAKAGLTDETKPLASLLFVGPTGVGKTEIAKVLATELGVELVRFDMSEYAEKHSVAKLIGSPAGYVGYEDGGQLTDAVRKHPDCVLLLDEIEKAHADIYNVLLQVMDYGKLTDNKGNRADFRNVVLIMTSNAGAQYAAQANVGFGSQIKAGESMMKQVKKTFKPEFINRLSGTVIFNDMDNEMASLIFDKKLRGLQKQLSSKNVTLKLTEEARQYLLKQGITREYGAREIERVINQQLKPLLMREILFGRFKNGGTAEVGFNENKLKLM